MTIGERIKYFRVQNELTQKALGEMTGIGEKTIQKYELSIRFPKLAQLEKIAQALGVSKSDLLGVKDTDIRLETVGDFMKILITLCNSNIISISGKRGEDGTLDKETVSIHFENSIIFSDILNFSIDGKGIITPDELTIKITNPLVMDSLIKWESANHAYITALEKYGDVSDDDVKRAISPFVDAKEKLELKLKNESIMLDISDGHIKVKLPPDIFSF